MLSNFNVRYSLKELFKQAVRFVGLSGIGWLIDMTAYSILIYITKDPFYSNICSSVVGASFVFVVSTRVVFQNSKRISLTMKYGIYIVYQIVLIILMSKLLSAIDNVILTYITWEMITRFSAVLAKILVTPVTMTLNFFVMKGVIEKL